jgi:hypothetical protein
VRNDIRIDVAFPAHFKTERLRRKLGPGAVDHLVSLFCFTAQRRPDGVLTGLTAQDIAIAARWQGDADELVRALLEAGWLDETGGWHAIHHWEENQPWVAGARARSDAARELARKRWTGTGEDVSRNAAVLHGANPNRASRTSPRTASRNAERNAPSPSPSPTPTPSPSLSEAAWGEALAPTRANAEDTWRRALPLLESRMDSESYGQWVATLVPLGQIDGTIVFGLDEEWKSRWVYDNFLDTIKDALRDIHGPTSVRLHVLAPSVPDAPHENVGVT